MASEIVYVDALPYFDQGYDEPGVREAVHLLEFLGRSVVSSLPIFINPVDTVVCSGLFTRCSHDLQTGVKTLRTQDTSDPRHFGTSTTVPKCPDTSTPVP